MATHGNKKRILCLLQILMERTDEEHILNAIDLCSILKAEYDLEADRRTIYSEVDALSDFGIDIVQIKGKNPGYYIGSRDFELAEVKILVDAVQSSKFVSAKKSQELIKKLEKLCSEQQAKQLNPQIVIANRPKTKNETILYNVDQIHTAIYQDKKISFQYVEWVDPKTQRLRRNGTEYVISPLWMLPEDDCYYMIGFDSVAGKIKYYRVDRMIHMEITKEEREGKEYLETFDLASFEKKTFGMHSGNDTEVVLKCKNEITSVIMDQFGSDAWMIPIDEGNFKIKTVVAVSGQFFGWLTGLGCKVTILEPENVKQEYRQYLKDIMENY